MALFGRRKPEELFAEAKKYTDLVYDWLLHPMQQYNFSLVDGVQTEYYLLAICSYLAQEKISPAARDYLAEAVVRSSNYGKKYVKDLKKECGFMSVLLQTMKQNERDARKARTGVLLALVKLCFKDFSKYEEPEKVKLCVHSTINQFLREIEPTDYKTLRLEVPGTARTAGTSGYSAPAPTTRTSTAPRTSAPPSSGKPIPIPPMYTVYQEGSSTPMGFNSKGKLMEYRGRIYTFAEQHNSSKGIAMLDLSVNPPKIVTDPDLRNALCDIFRRENPELAHLIPAPKAPPKQTSSAPARTEGADYFISGASGDSVPFNQHGKKIIYQNRIYELLIRVGGDRELKFLDVTDRSPAVVRDQNVIAAIREIFLRENPELKYLVRWTKPRPDLPDYFNLRDSRTGKSKRVDVLIWEEVNGFCFGFCPQNDGTATLIMRTGDGSYVDAGSNSMADFVLKTMRQKYPAFF